MIWQVLAWGISSLAARFAMHTAIAKALEQGAAVVSIVKANHIGRLGYYTEQAAAQGLVGSIWAGGFGVGAPAAAPFGGRERLLHTNPLSMAFPAGSGRLRPASIRRPCSISPPRRWPA